MALEPLAYVCVVSAFNVPELESCLARRPGHVLLVVSDAYLPHALRLGERLRECLPGVQVHNLHKEYTGHALGGDDILENQRWVQTVLLAELAGDQLKSLPPILNFTGGTKAMTLALLHCHAWQALDYKAAGKRELQVVRPDTHAPGQFVPHAPLPLPEVSAMDVARLYADVQADPLNAIIAEQPTLSLELAGAIWQAQQDGDVGLRHLFNGLEKIWVEGRNNDFYRQRSLTLGWQDFGQDPADPTAGATLGEWLRRFQSLAPQELRMDGTGITLPGNKPAGLGKALRQWISGVWLEQLAYQWLLEDRLPASSVARNLKSGQLNSSAAQREADLLVHHQQDTSLVEIKAGLPPDRAPSDLEQQISSLGNRFGRTRKALLIAPQLRSNLGKSWASFELRCAANQIQLIEDRQGLLDFVRKRKRQ